MVRKNIFFLFSIKKQFFYQPNHLNLGELWVISPGHSTLFPNPMEKVNVDEKYGVKKWFNVNLFNTKHIKS